MQRRSTLLLLALVASVSGLAVLLRTPVKSLAGDSLHVGAHAERPKAPVSGEIDLVEPGPSELESEPGAEASMGRRSPTPRTRPNVELPVRGEQWKVFFRPIPRQESPLQVCVHPERGGSLFAVSSVVEDSDLHVALVTLPRAAIERATLRVATSTTALNARDGRPVLLTDTTNTWVLGAVRMGTGSRSTRALTVTGLTVPLQGLYPVGQLTVSGNKKSPVDVLVWTSPKEGYPLHTLVEKTKLNAPLTFGSFVASEHWFADVSPGKANVQSQGAAIGRMGTDLLLQLRAEPTE